MESIAVSLLHSYANPSHEQRLLELIRAESPDLPVTLSSAVLPEIQEYERASTTVINAYVQPVVRRYFLSMERDLRGLGLNNTIMVMQSNGGMMPSDLARERPVHIIESGPAAGVTGCAHRARKMGLQNVMTLDMGGTTAKAALIEDGQVSRSPEYEVGGPVSIGHRLVKGSGFVLRVPSVDLAEVGAGGGSVAWADEAGALRVGPHSAGADPGPACYNLGGEQPTITDANVFLGFTNPEYLAGGSLPVHPHLAEKAITDVVASPLGLDTTVAAWGIRTIANSSLIRALRAVSTERGRDPRRFDLFAFGGMGPVHAADLAAELGINRVIVPPLAGLFSALGLLFADVEHHLIRTFYGQTQSLDYGRANQVIDDVQAEAASTLLRGGFDSASQRLELSVDARYVGQDYALTIPLSDAHLQPDRIGDLVEAFHQEHQKTYGYRSDKEAVQVVAFRCLGRALSRTSRVPETLQVAEASTSTPSSQRRAYFGPDTGWLDTPVTTRDALPNSPRPGPVLVEEDTSLTLVPPGWQVSLDEWSNILLTHDAAS